MMNFPDRLGGVPHVAACSCNWATKKPGVGGVRGLTSKRGPLLFAWALELSACTPEGNSGLVHTYGGHGGRIPGWSLGSRNHLRLPPLANIRLYFRVSCQPAKTEVNTNEKKHVVFTRIAEQKRALGPLEGS